MALSPQILGPALRVAVQSVADPQDNQDQVFENMAKAIIDHLLSAGVTITVIPGGSSAGTHLGTIT